MPTKEERATEAAKHYALVKAVFAKETQASIESAAIYEEGDGRDLAVPDARFDTTQVDVTTDFAVRALCDTTGKAVVVDPGAFTKPGGNYLNGAFGPEQALCAESNLFAILQGMKKSYYDGNRDYWRGGLFSDRAMYLHDVAFNHNGDERTADVVVVAAPHRTQAMEHHRSAAECDQTLHDRIETLLHVAASGGADVLVCNAFGCGVMGNDAAQVAGLFKAWLDAHPGVFERVVFAVPRVDEQAFKDVFAIKEPEPEPVVTASEEDEDDDEDFDISDLPEGVTLRS